jgi:flagellar biosynthesis repressor protein FlbT
MALKVELKPNERIIVGTVVIRADDQRTKLFIEGQAPILREKDILTPKTADTPAKRIYLTVQLMYLDGDSSRQHDLYFDLIRDFLQAAPSARSKVAEINNCILSGELYKALKAAKALIAYEAELMAHVPSA